MPSRPAVLTALCLVAALIGPNVAADSEVATGASATWGTALVANRAGKVLAMVEAGGLLYLGGEFTAMAPPGSTGEQDGVPRNHLAALEVASGNLTVWDPGANGPVRALVLSRDGRRLYVGGDFNTIGGQSVRKLAVIDLATGAVDPTFQAGVAGRVRALALSGNRLYAGGDFQEAGGQPRPQLAAFDARTGALLDWIPPENGGGMFVGQTGQPSDAGPGTVDALAVSADGDIVHAGGTFTNFGGRAGLLSLDVGTGEAIAWQAEMKRPVFGLSISPADGHTLYAATGGAGGRVYSFDPGGRTAATWSGSFDGDAVAVVASADTVYVAGHYDNIVAKGSKCYQYCPGGPVRRHLAAFDAATGSVDPWGPTANTSTGPFTAAVGAQHLYVGGEFTKINGHPQQGIAQFAGTP
jgi:beta-propeller uncharacterized protein DUF5122